MQAFSVVNTFKIFAQQVFANPRAAVCFVQLWLLSSSARVLSWGYLRPCNSSTETPKKQGAETAALGGSVSGTFQTRFHGSAFTGSIQGNQSAVADS